MNPFNLFTHQVKDPDELMGTPLVPDKDGELSRDLFQRYDNPKRREWARVATENNEFRNGIQWTRDQENDLEASGLSPVVVNAIFPAIEAMKAALTAKDPGFTVTGREGSDMKLGSVFADLLSYIWQRNKGKSELRQAIDDYVVQGVGAMYAWVNPTGDNGRPEIEFGAVAPKDLFIDPNSKDRYARDAAHILIVKTLTDEQIQATYPEYANLLPSIPKESLLNLHGASGVVDLESSFDNESARYKVIDRFSRIKKMEWVMYDPSTGQDWVTQDGRQNELLDRQVLIETTVHSGQKMILDEVQLRQAAQYYEKFGEVFHYVMDPNDPSAQPFPMAGPEAEHNDPATEVVPGSETKLQPTTMGELVKQGALMFNPNVVSHIRRVLSFGDVTVWKTDYEFDIYPIVPCYNRWNRTPYAEGDIPLVKQLQIYINKLRAILILHAANSAGVKLLVSRGSADREELKKEWIQPGMNVFEVDMEFGPPVQSAPPPLPNELYNNENKAKEDIQQILGAYLLSQGDPSNAPDTHRGTLAIDEYGQRRIKNKKDDIEGFIAQFGQLLIALIQKYYTEPKVVRLIRPNNIGYNVRLNYTDDYSEGAAKINDISVGRFDVVVVSGSTLPINRWAQFEYYLELYKLNAIDRVELLKHSEVTDPEEILQRMDEIEQLRQQLSQAMDQIKNLEGDLQTARRESVHDRMKVEVTEFTSKLDGMKTSAAAATELYRQRLRDEVQLAASSLKRDAE